MPIEADVPDLPEPPDHGIPEVLCNDDDAARAGGIERGGEAAETALLERHAGRLLSNTAHPRVATLLEDVRHSLPSVIAQIAAGSNGEGMLDDQRLIRTLLHVRQGGVPYLQELSHDAEAPWKHGEVDEHIRRACSKFLPVIMDLLEDGERADAEQQMGVVAQGRYAGQRLREYRTNVLHDGAHANGVGHVSAATPSVVPSPRPARPVRQSVRPAEVIRPEHAAQTHEWRLNAEMMQNPLCVSVAKRRYVVTPAVRRLMSDHFAQANIALSDRVFLEIGALNPKNSSELAGRIATSVMAAPLKNEDSARFGRDAAGNMHVLPAQASVMRREQLLQRLPPNVVLLDQSYRPDGHRFNEELLELGAGLIKKNGMFIVALDDHRPLPGSVAHLHREFTVREQLPCPEEYAVRLEELGCTTEFHRGGLTMFSPVSEGSGLIKDMAGSFVAASRQFSLGAVSRYVQKHTNGGLHYALHQNVTFVVARKK